MSGKTEWIYCPVCGSKTRPQIRLDTELKNIPLYCPKCKQGESNLKITVKNMGWYADTQIADNGFEERGN